MSNEELRAQVAAIKAGDKVTAEFKGKFGHNYVISGVVETDDSDDSEQHCQEAFREFAAALLGGEG